jgi:LmbE family N-acetylglucosaminyl deacetylase
MVKKLLLLQFIFFFFCWVEPSAGQKPLPFKASNTENVLLQIKKFNQFGTVLYFAAHPDDENTRLITWFANEKGFKTAYQSLTRGDGGQNLIGTEVGTDLGVLRTHELLAARKIDGGEQYFSRAYDFGYSKNPEETFEFWDEEALLKDVVYLIRKLRPDIIVNRFPPNERAGHGHHTASAMLSIKAFDLAADPNVFPEQLNELEVWQPQSLYLNTSTWWEPNLNPDWHSDTLIAVNIGQYAQMFGKNYTEIAALSRSMHRCQGFGSMQYRGETFDFMRHVKGEKQIEIIDPKLQGWDRINAPKRIKKIAENLEKRYLANLNSPEALWQDINTLHAWLSSQDNFWAARKKQELEDILFHLAGLKFEWLSNTANPSVNQSIESAFEAINRSNFNVIVNEISFGAATAQILDITLPNNQVQKQKIESIIPAKPFNKFWLNQKPNGFFALSDAALAVQPETYYPVKAKLSFSINEIKMEKDLALTYKYVDPAFGERNMLAVPTPEVFIISSEGLKVISPGDTCTIKFAVKANENIRFTPKIKLPKGWQILGEPSAINLSKNQETQIQYALVSSNTEGRFSVEPILETENGQVNLIRKQLRYEHIPYQDWFEPFEQAILSVNLAKPKNEKVAYIKGAGDLVPETLKKMGYKVDLFDENFPKNIAEYQVVIAGVRALNTNEALASNLSTLHKFAQNGGVVLFQYNTNRGLITENFAPPGTVLKLNRDRVTEEDAKPNFLAPNHPVLKYPNQISDNDFEHWVQERGLYFASEWSSEFTPIIAWNDKGESPKEGALLVGEIGEGYFIYTGISFFRQLPAGVEGALKLFQNLIEVNTQKNKSK